MLGPGQSDRRLRSRRNEAPGLVLLACEKCERRLAKEGRFRQITQLQQALDAIATEAQANGSGLQILSVPCMDVCPRGAMAVASGDTPDEVLIVRSPEDLRLACAMVVDSAAGALAGEQGVNEGVPSSDAR